MSGVVRVGGRLSKHGVLAVATDPRHRASHAGLENLLRVSFLTGSNDSRASVRSCYI